MNGGAAQTDRAAQENAEQVQVDGALESEDSHALLQVPITAVLAVSKEASHMIVFPSLQRCMS
ncbi:hypothetical protein WH50_05400 [Pokkaliibacter plantistimulans]|uniref:Uncharacterized protein n=1 Tax=Pokkaliibacter plantistimulans TaxID=1635171 RepID=A0ABX5M1U0_9GAMM|nr:hypothetical protein [Pokkaliibacter plantistimulans]PXF32339.1 hypothetical protein WH50_05400 [Pokkaliibacter plantistimulans]